MSKLPQVKKRNKILVIMICLPLSPSCFNVLTSLPVNKYRMNWVGDFEKKYPKDECELFQWLKITWESLPIIFFQKLLERMSQICITIIKADGDFIDEKIYDAIV